MLKVMWYYKASVNFRTNSLSLPYSFTIVLFYDLKELVPEAASSFVNGTNTSFTHMAMVRNFMGKTI